MNNQDVGVQHLIWSGLIDVTKLTNGKFPNVYHFDSKAHIDSYIRSIGVPSSTFTPGFYMSNLESMMNPSPVPPHAYTLALPMPPSTPIPFFDAAGDTGKFVKAMLLKRDKVLGKNVLAATDYYAAADVPKIFEQVKQELGKGAQFMTIDKETYKGFLTGAGMPEFAAQELYENMAFIDEFGYFGKESLDWSLSVGDFFYSDNFLAQEFCLYADKTSLYSCWTRNRRHSRSSLPRRRSGTSLDES